MEALTLQLKINDKWVINLMKRYHFSGSDGEMIKSLATSILPLTDAKAYYVMKTGDEEIKYSEYAICVVTLGSCFDKMQSLYMERNCISEAYMLDCIGLELMSAGYEQLVKHLQEKYGKWALAMDFIGETYPMELLPKLLDEFQNSGVTCNKEFMLSPLKSVLFFLPFTDKKVDAKPCDICVNCGNKECIFRKSDEDEISNIHIPDLAMQKNQMKMSYGASQIFSKKNL